MNTEMPVFVIKAKDLLAVEAVEAALLAANRLLQPGEFAMRHITAEEEAKEDW